MDLAVWAHWRYRALGLEHAVAEATEHHGYMLQLNMLTEGRMRTDEEVTEAKEAADFYSWLLEEAKYMCELGAAYDAREALCSMPL